MKRLLTIFIIACVFFSCENDRPANDPNNGQKPIKFDMTETRADITASNIETDGFGVFAFVNKGADGTPGSTTFVSLFGEEAEKVYKDDADDWTYDHTKFWDANRIYHFFGVYPFDAPYSITKDISGNPTGISRTFTTPATADEDLVLARATYDTSIAPPTAVEMNFQHMLAKVSLNVWRDGAKHQNDDMRIKSVTLSNIGKAGTYTSTTDAWTYNGEKMTMEYEKEGEFSERDNIGAFVNGAGTGGVPSKPFGELMLLPQDIGGLNSVVALNIEYELMRQGATDWETATLEAELPIITWRAGQQYTYNVVLSQVKYITVYYIQTKVDPWGTPQVGGTVIIK